MHGLAAGRGTGDTQNSECRDESNCQRFAKEQGGVSVVSVPATVPAVADKLDGSRGSAGNHPAKGRWHSGETRLNGHIAARCKALRTG
jgi:hypothetical protein